MLFSALLGFLLFSQVPDGLSVVGYVVICGVSVAMFFYNRCWRAGSRRVAIRYELRRSGRKTLSVEVSREGQVIVRAPLRMSVKRIEQFVGAHAGWIAQAQAR